MSYAGNVTSLPTHWRWSLSGHDDLSEERGHRLWRRIIHWLAEPVQGEALRIRPERWLTPAGEPVRLFATLQDSQFRPVAGARIEGEVQDASGGVQRILFEPALPARMVLRSLCVCGAYTTGALLLAVILFERRDIKS